MERKLIKILDRKMVLTSRGLVRGPIIRPYQEKINAILTMITRYDANVVEVLPDGSEVTLTIHNFNKDNSVKVKEEIPTIPQRTEEPPREIQPTQAIDAHMSRKERKRLEAERRKEEADKKAAEEAAKSEPVEETPVVEETTIEEPTTNETETTPVTNE